MKWLAIILCIWEMQSIAEIEPVYLLVVETTVSETDWYALQISIQDEQSTHLLYLKFEK